MITGNDTKSNVRFDDAYTRILNIELICLMLSESEVVIYTLKSTFIRDSVSLHVSQKHNLYENFYEIM